MTSALGTQPLLPRFSAARERRARVSLKAPTATSEASRGKRGGRRSAAAAAAGEEQAPPARAAATVFVYGVAAYTRAFAPLTKGIALVILLAAFHACLRVAATERAAWTAAASAERQRKVPSYAAAGVPFRDAAFGAPRAEASAQRDEKDQEDPRRCLRELEAAARALASAAAIGAKAGAAAGVDAAVAKAKALRQQLR